MHHDIILLMHHIDFFFLYIYIYRYCANLPSALVYLFIYFFFLFGFVLVSCPYPSTMLRKTKAHRIASSLSESPFQSELFWSEKNKELYETLNIKRKIWAKRKVLLDEIDPAIRANLSLGAGCHCWILVILLQLP